MLSASLSCKKTIYRKQMTRFWPLWALYGVAWLFAVPINMLVNFRYYDAKDLAGHAKENILQSIPEFGLYIALIFGVLVAMAVWSYLYNNRSVGMMHTLPIRREGLFVSNWMAGISFFVLPNLVTAILTLGVEAIYGIADVKTILIWFTMQTLLCLFFFSMATICAFVTGSLLALPALYGIFNGLVAGVLVLLNEILRMFLYGYSNMSDAMETIAEFGTPVVAFHTTIKLQQSYDAVSDTWTTDALAGLGTVTVYALVGLVMSVLAFLLYRRRSLEMAGEVIAVGFLRPVFKYGVSFCGALAFGMLLFSIFICGQDENAWMLLFFMLLCGAISYYAAEMLLKKSFRVFRKNWKGCVVFLVLLTVGSAAVNLDVMGYETWLPAQEDVVQVELKDLYTSPSDSLGDYTPNHNLYLEETPEEIAQTIALHQAILGHRDSGTDYNGEEEMADGVWIQNRTYQQVGLSYKLTNGKTVDRSYQILLTAEDLALENTPAAKLNALVNHPQTLKNGFFPDILITENLIGGSVEAFDKQTDMGDGDGMKELGLTREDAQLLYTAILEDMEASRIGRQWFMETDEYLNTVYQNKIKLSFEGDFTSLFQNNDTYSSPYETKEEIPDFVNVYVHPQTNSSSTLAVLRKLGLMDNENAFLTALAFQQQQYKN